MVAGLLFNGCWVVSQWLLGWYSMVAGLLVNGCWDVIQRLLGCYSVVAGLLRASTTKITNF